VSWAISCRPGGRCSTGRSSPWSGGDRPSFALLQQRLHVAGPTARLLAAVPVAYYVFDVLHLDGMSLLDARTSSAGTSWSSLA
jgi:hypothetical protein